MNILIVDDNKDHQVLMEEALVKLIDEVNIVFASTGEECFHELIKEKYDAIVIDFNLSDMDGLEVLRRMKDNEYVIPAIMVTAFGDENIAVDAMKLGAFDYIVKSDEYLNRLSSIIIRVMQEPKLKKEKEKVENDLRASELKYKILIIRSGLLTYLFSRFFINHTNALLKSIISALSESISILVYINYLRYHQLMCL